MTRQMQPVSGTYGAPMGRHSTGRPDDMPARSIRLFRVKLDSGGYDDGGAYWGLRSRGQAIFAAEGLDYFATTDAHNREEAREALGIEAHQLARPITRDELAAEITRRLRQHF